LEPTPAHLTQWHGLAAEPPRAPFDPKAR